MRFLIAFFVAFAVQTAQCAAETWELVKPDGLGFEVEFPGKPEFTEQTGDDGGKIRTYVVKSPAAAYDVTIFDLPEGAVKPDNVAQLLDAFRDSNLDGVRAKFRSEARIRDRRAHGARCDGRCHGHGLAGPLRHRRGPLVSDRGNYFES